MTADARRLTANRAHGSTTGDRNGAIEGRLASGLGLCTHGIDRRPHAPARSTQCRSVAAAVDHDVGAFHAVETGDVFDGSLSVLLLAPIIHNPGRQSMIKPIALI